MAPTPILKAPTQPQPLSAPQVLNECVLDEEDKLSFSEFELAMAKSPDFLR